MHGRRLPCGSMSKNLILRHLYVCVHVCVVCVHVHVSTYSSTYVQRPDNNCRWCSSGIGHLCFETVSHWLALTTQAGLLHKHRDLPAFTSPGLGWPAHHTHFFYLALRSSARFLVQCESSSQVPNIVVLNPLGRLNFTVLKHFRRYALTWNLSRFT